MSTKTRATIEDLYKVPARRSARIHEESDMTDESSRPLSADEVRALPSLPASMPLPDDTSARLGSYVIDSVGVRAPEISTCVTPIESDAGSAGWRFRIDLEARGVGLPLEARLPRVRARQASTEALGRYPLERLDLGHRPEYFDLRPLPQRLPPRDVPLELLDDQHPAEDQRYAFSDRSFPWCTFGRVTTGGSGFKSSGVMVGPRHLLTASRIVGWHGDSPADWIQFDPAYFHGATPFGVAHAETIYFWRQLDILTTNRDLMAHDYVVCVLDRRLGDVTGWIGSWPYQQIWDGMPIWALVAYSRDFGGGEELVFQDQVAFQTTVPPGGSGLDLLHHAWLSSESLAALFNELGGPFFAWWAGEPWPRVVATHSAWEGGHLPDGHPGLVNKWAAGGDPLVRLIQQARAEFP